MTERKFGTCPSCGIPRQLVQTMALNKVTGSLRLVYVCAKCQKRMREEKQDDAV